MQRLTKSISCLALASGYRIIPGSLDEMDGLLGQEPNTSEEPTSTMCFSTSITQVGQIPGVDYLTC